MGRSEIVAGAPGAKRPDDATAAGATYLVRAADVSGPILALDAGHAWISLYGSNAGDLYGAALAVGRAGNTPATHLWAGARSASSGRGEATGLFGGRSIYPGVISLEQSAMDWKLEGPLNSGGAFTPVLGGSVAMGDFDGEGKLDLAAGAFGADLGSFMDAGIVALVMNEDATDVEEPVVSSHVEQLQLSLRGSNPSRGNVQFGLAVPTDADVEIVAYDVAGRLVWKEARRFTAGHHDFEWDRTRQDGTRVASGVFLFKARAGEKTSTQRVVLLR